MAAINFPAASESPWYNPDNGITYEYIGGTWRSVNQLSGAFDSKYVEVDGDNMTGNLTLGTDKIELKAGDGSATFSGDITAPGAATIGGTHGEFKSAQVASSSNFVRMRTKSDNGQSDIFIRSADTNSNTEAAIDIRYGTDKKLEVQNSGTLRIGSDLLNNSENILLDSSGSATFAGPITSTNNDGFKLEGTGTNTQFYSIGKDSTGGTLQIKRADTVLMSMAFNGNTTFVGTITAPNVTFNLEPDNPANYTTTTDTEGNETQVYNGPTLDVKERLTKADVALQNLKTAVANAVDFAELKAAMTTALADI